MSWNYTLLDREVNLWSERVDAQDGIRQAASAREILRRLSTQPGVILGDEVGMGKTFVALAVAASVALEDQRRRPVIVMVPPSLQKKWAVDGAVFNDLCMAAEQGTAGKRRQLRIQTADSAVGLLAHFDDPEETRAHVIVLRHGAVAQALRDPWVKLAVLKAALRSPKLARQRDAMPRYAARLIRSSLRAIRPSLCARLLSAPTGAWRSILDSSGHEQADDPVPVAIADALASGRVDLTGVRTALSGMPLNDSAGINQRIAALRTRLNEVLPSVWAQILRVADFTSPLLILDEAHHLKNARTKLASLFADEAKEDEPHLKGLLAGRFERMLFLTATPFQLGHHELLGVLDRFQGIAWPSSQSGMRKSAYTVALGALRVALDEAHRTSSELDRRWSKLSADLLDGANGSAMSPEAWWVKATALREAESADVQDVLGAYDRTAVAMRTAEDLLRPWIIRHRREPVFGTNRARRREEHDGEAIVASTDTTARGLGPVRGLAVSGEALLPFLLAARAHVIAIDIARTIRGDRSVRGVETFADGLASSYEAFLETRSGVADGLDEDSESEVVDAGVLGKQLAGYVEDLAAALPGDSAYGRHPKISATVQRVLELWDAREKVVVFCHWKATGRALQKHISAAIEAEVKRRAAKALSIKLSEVDRKLEQIAKRFDDDGSLGQALDRVVKRVLDSVGVEDFDVRRQISAIVRRFARTPSFVVRYVPLDRIDDPLALREALGQNDASGLALQRKIESFVRFIQGRREEERVEYLGALREIQTGERFVSVSGRKQSKTGSRLLANVRLVNGDMTREDRRRLLLAFNTPFFPEILIATSVMAEGVDLHLDCRHVIHHDLAWNPSTLEQRTGRVDRIGSKAERSSCSIQVYHPFVGASQDEKMYRVVMDRRRWFQVLMGADYILDETTSERVALRMPLPANAAAPLAFRLEVEIPGVDRQKPETAEGANSLSSESTSPTDADMMAREREQ